MTCNWNGYVFDVFQPPVTWNDVPGVYIFAKIDGGYWRALYIGQTGSLSQRLTNHERWSEAARLGATHIHTFVEYSGLHRINIESNLVSAFQPPLNS